MEILTEILNWYFMLIIKIIMAAGIVAVIIMLLIFLGCFLLVRGTEYLQDKIDSFTEKPPVINDPAPVPPAATGTACGNQTWITGKDDYGVNMEGMNCCISGVMFCTVGTNRINGVFCER